MAMASLMLTAASTTGCQSTLISGSGPSGLLAAEPPHGYQLNSRASGALKLEAAAQATPVPADELGADLRAAGYSDGYARIWTHDADFVSALAFELGGRDKAESFVSQQRARLLEGTGTEVVADPDVPGAFLFLLFGSVSLHSEQVFCQGEIFSSDRFAIEVDACSPLPNSAAGARAEARREYEHASRALGVSPISAATPTP
jgi:hypothetical protein